MDRISIPNFVIIERRLYADLVMTLCPICGSIIVRYFTEDNVLDCNRVRVLDPMYQMICTECDRLILQIEKSIDVSGRRFEQIIQYLQSVEGH